MKKRLGLLARIAFGVAGCVFVVFVFLETWDRAEGLALPSAPELGVATVLLVVGLWFASRAWSALLETSGDRQLAAGFYLAQLGKYIPGSIWQAVGQIGYARDSGVRLSRSTVSFGVMAVTQVAAGGILGGTLAFAGTDVLPSVRLGAGVVLLSGVLLHRRWLVWLVARWPWHRTQLEEKDARELVPAQSAIMRAWLCGLATLTCGGLAFAVVTPELSDPQALILTVPTFALAWTIGFLALPVPAGLGVREAVLIGGLAGVVPAPEVIAASVVIRLVYIAAEVLMVVLSRVWLLSGSRS